MTQTRKVKHEKLGRRCDGRTADFKRRRVAAAGPGGGRGGSSDTLELDPRHATAARAHARHEMMGLHVSHPRAKNKRQPTPGAPALDFLLATSPKEGKNRPSIAASSKSFPFLGAVCVENI